MSLLLGLEPLQKFAVVVGGGWSKGILEFRFGPDLGLRLEAWTKLNKNILSRGFLFHLLLKKLYEKIV